ncbi:MAG TPA: branched-chain amino acid ABC transporter permease [Tepidisphaeraceae bacterium]|nr:branched-chain amino acid ABC transporter permease [Tepidisphaeraceae bacterium]
MQTNLKKIDWTKLMLIMIGAPLAALAFAALVHASSSFLGDYNQRVVLTAGIAIISAVSLNVVNGFTGQFSMGHAAFIALGGYVSGFISYYVTLSITDSTTSTEGWFGWNQWLMAGSAIIAGVVTALAGLVVGLPSLRLKGDYLAIVTLGFGEIMRVLLTQSNPIKYTKAEVAETGGWGSIFYPPALGGASGFYDIPKATNIFWVYLFVGLTVLAIYRLKQSSYGRAMISIREDEIAAKAMGIKITRLKVRAFMLAAFFAGIAGTLYAHQPYTLLSPTDAGFARSFDLVMIIVLGGLGSISGSILAAIVITILNARLVAYAEYRMIIFSLILILMMIFRPQGLFGLREIWDFFKPKRKVARGFEVIPK